MCKEWGSGQNEDGKGILVSHGKTFGIHSEGTEKPLEDLTRK